MFVMPMDCAPKVAFLALLTNTVPIPVHLHAPVPPAIWRCLLANQFVLKDASMDSVVLSARPLVQMAVRCVTEIRAENAAVVGRTNLATNANIHV